MKSGITTRPDVEMQPSRFVPDGFCPTDLEALRNLSQQLLERPLDTAAAVEAWLRDRSEVTASVRAGATRRRIAMTRNTADPALRARYLEYEKTVIPEHRRLEDLLSRRYLASKGRADLGPRFAVYDREVAESVALFRPENAALELRDTELAAEYAALVGNRTIDFRGDSRTTQQVREFMLGPDRVVREEAYRALTRAGLDDADRAESIFDTMLGVRAEIARNAGLPDYRAYRFRELARFDYAPADCTRFHDAVEQAVVPLVAERMERKRRLLGVSRLRPWDAGADARGRDPKSRFSDESGYVDLVRRLFRAIDPAFAEDFEILVRNGLLDLMARPGKAPGGYNAPVSDIRLPFVFANAVGSHRDVRTLLHEGGHAFHTLATRDEPILALTRAPMEFCEVASMAMELFGLEHYRVIYDAPDARAAAISLLELRLVLPTWAAAVDAFQHWMYTHPGHTVPERREVWVGLRRRFAPWIDVTGVEEERAVEWHWQLHLFRSPFYYIEYPLALTGALQVWRRYRENPSAAVADYRNALSLGSTRPLPDLYAAAGARFGMDVDLLAEVFGDLHTRLVELDPF